MRHDEDGDRKTAAHFTLASPDQVREFVQRGSQWLAYKNQASGEAWDYTFDGYDPQSEKLREALCTVGNGYFATRGAAPESKAGQVHYPGTYAAGVYNRLVNDVSGAAIDNESLVNLPNWLALTFRIDGGSWFDIDAVTVLSYRQTLDLRGAVLTREVRFTDDAGRTSSLTQQRFVAMHMPHVGALATTIVAEDWSGTIEVRSTLDGNVRNALVERYRDLADNHLELLDKREISDNSVLLTVQTTQSRIPIAMAARSTVWRDGEPVPATYRLFDEAAEIGHDIAVQLSVGEALTVEKVVTLYTGRDVATSEPAVDAQRWLSRLGRFAQLLDGHLTEWVHLWERLSIEFDDFTDELRILRLHLLHLLQTVSLNASDLDVGVPARGLHGEAYRGHIFWDELFIFPVLNLRLPMITRSLLRYRYRRLPEARHAAAAAGYAGAMFPWQSGSDGREESPLLHLNPRSGRWNPDSSARAQHIGIAVAYNAWKFYQVTGDLAYLIDYGAEMLAEIARFFVSRASYDEERDRYSIRGVIGPDEFHSGYPSAPYDGIDNNAYTNVMAVWVIMRAFDALSLLPLPNRLDLRETLGLRSDELAHWEEVSRRMFVPFHSAPSTGPEPGGDVISQFEGYGELERTGLGPLPREIRQHPAPGPHPGGRGRRRQSLQGFEAGRRVDAAVSDVVGRVGRATRPARLPFHARSDAARWSTTTWPGHPTDPRSVVSCTPGCWPAPIGIGPWSSSHRSQVRRDRHPGWHHGRGDSPRGDGRQRRPHAALLHRAGDPFRSRHPVAALAGNTGRTGSSDSLSRSASAPSGQRQRRDHQRGSARRRLS